MTDTKAPKRIWAFYAPEIEEDNPQCTIVAGDAVMHGAQQYIRADLYNKLLRAVDELARAVEDDLSVWHESMTEESELKSALAAYKQAKENIND